MLNDVTDFGAIGDGVTDCRAAIQAAIDDAVLQNKGGILIPAGTYRVSRATTTPGRWSLDLNGVQDFMVAGEGARSVVKLVNSTAPTGDWHVLILRNNCRRVTITDLVIDGNRTGLTDPDEQSHGIEGEDGTEDLVIDRCIMRECFGDGVRLLGTAATGENVRRVRITNSLFQTNKRSGLAVQRALEQILVANCIFDGTVTDQSIDFEPSGTDGPTDFIVEGCIIHHTNQTIAVSLSGISGPDRLIRAKFTNNLVIGGRVFCTDVSQLTIQNNVVVVPPTPGNRIPLQVQRGGDALLITGNMLIGQGDATEAVLSVSEVNQRPVVRALLANNLCVARSGSGIRVLSCDDISVTDNMVVAAGACTQGVFVRSESSDVDGVSIRGNDITVEGAGTWHTGVRISATAPNRVLEVSVVDNAIKGAQEGVRFDGPGFRRTPVCALNRIEAGVAQPLVGLANLPEDAIVVGGAASRGGGAVGAGAGRMLAGPGDPNGRVEGDVGDLYQRLDGGPGTTLYVKESGAHTPTGWTAK